MHLCMLEVVKTCDEDYSRRGGARYEKMIAALKTSSFMTESTPKMENTEDRNTSTHAYKKAPSHASSLTTLQ